MALAAAKTEPVAATPVSGAKNPIPARPLPIPQVNKETKKELQKQQKIFHQLEERIGRLTIKKGELQGLLTDPSVYSDKSRFREAEKNFHDAEKELSQLNNEYEQAFERIMELENNPLP